MAWMLAASTLDKPFVQSLVHPKTSVEMVWGDNGIWLPLARYQALDGVLMAWGIHTRPRLNAVPGPEGAQLGRCGAWRGSTGEGLERHAQGRQRWGLPLAGNIVAIPEDLVAFSQGIVRENGKDWTSFIASQAPLLDLFSWIQELVQVSTRSAEGFVQTMTLINNVG